MLKSIFIIIFFICFMSVSSPAQDVPARELFNKGSEESKKGNLDAAIQSYSEAIKIDSGYSQAFSARGIIYMKRRQLDLAIYDFSTAIALKSNSPGYYINRSSAYSLKKEFEKSLADLAKAEEIDPTFADIYSARGNIYRQMKEFEKAVESFSKAIEIKPYSYFYSGRCMAYFDFGKFEKAIEDCSDGISLNPKDLNALYYRGLSRLKLEQKALAIADFRRVVEINPNYLGAKNQLETLLKNQ